MPINTRSYYHYYYISDIYAYVLDGVSRDLAKNSYARRYSIPEIPFNRARARNPPPPRTYKRALSAHFHITNGWPVVARFFISVYLAG